MAIRAALLDGHASSGTGVFLCVEELEDESRLTPFHVPQVTECDLPPGEYQWVPNASNPMGGAFWSVDWMKKFLATREQVKLAETRKPKQLPPFAPDELVAAIKETM